MLVNSLHDRHYQHGKRDLELYSRRNVWVEIHWTMALTHIRFSNLTGLPFKDKMYMSGGQGGQVGPWFDNYINQG